MSEEGTAFVTFCRRCGKASAYPMEKIPETAAELEEARVAVAKACPNHGEISIDEARKKVSAGEYKISPAVTAELVEIVAGRIDTPVRKLRFGG